MVTTMLRNMNRNMLLLDKRQTQAATGKKFQRPHDDPIGVAKSLKMSVDINELEQFKNTVDDASAWLGTTELAIDNVQKALQRLRELTVQASNGILTPEDTAKISSEVNEIKDFVIGVGNTAYAGRYIFSGKKTNEALFNENGEYQVNLIDDTDPTVVDDKMQFAVGIGEIIAINTLGFEIFESTSPNTATTGNQAGMIQMIENIEADLIAGDTSSLTNRIAEIDDFINTIVTVRAGIGAKVNRLDSIRDRINDDNVNLRDLQSKIEDADMSEVYMKLAQEEYVYRSSLSVGAKIIQPTLIDFLR